MATLQPRGVHPLFKQAGSRAVRFQVGGIDHQLIRLSTPGCQIRKDLVECTDHALSIAAPSRVPETAFASMKKSQVRDIGGMVPAIAKILDACGKMFTGLQMPGSVTITLVPGVNKREVDH